MKIFYASSCSSVTHNACWRECGVKNLLFSYAQDDAMFRVNNHLYTDPTMNILVDSGAFTSWTKGKSIDVGEYIRFCEKALALSSATLVFINLDVIPGRFRQRPTRREVQESAAKGWRHYAMMAACDLPVMHVFHQHEDFEWLKDLASASDYIGVSPANDVSPKERKAWLCRVFDTIGSGVRTHGFGVTTVELMETFPFYSVDSSSWLAPSLYGGVTVFRGIRSGQRPALLTLTKDKWMNNLDVVAEHFVPALEGYKYVTNLSLQAYAQVERYITDLWAGRGVTWETKQCKPKADLRQLIFPRSQRSLSDSSGPRASGRPAPTGRRKRSSREP